MPRHSFVRMTKLTNVKGRVDYISSPRRQEHLYASYSTIEPEFWDRLAEQAHYDFWKGHQKNGKCYEARELIIALPESLQDKDPDLLLQLFTESFRKQYGVECTAALHHNKTMTNYHIHLVFADRDLLEEKKVSYATRNMFFNEEGRHVRTKKEILDADGNVRPGCRILAKGEIYEMKLFSGRRDEFKTKSFLADVKKMFTDLINQTVDREEDRLQVFNAAGPYLPTRKIGKNNPLEAEICSDNQLRQEWNHAVDQVLIAGGTQEEVTEFKHEEVVKKVIVSVQQNGDRPGLFADIIVRAIAILKEFLEILMKAAEKEDEKQKITGQLAAENVKKDGKASRPDSREAELRFMKIEPVYQNLNKCNRKLYALQKQKETVSTALNGMRKSIFNRGDRKALQERIDGLQRQIDQCRIQLEAIPKQYGYENVKQVTAEYRAAKKELDLIHRVQAEWDGITIPEIRIHTQKESESILKRLAAKQLEAEERKTKVRRIKRERKRGNEL